MNPLTLAERAALRAQHTPVEVPKCPVCGAQLIPCPTGTEGHWKCPAGAEGVKDFWTVDRRTPEFREAWRHNALGHYVERDEGRDPRVLRLLDEADALRAALQEIHHQAIDFCRRHCQGPRGHHPECGREYGELAGEALKDAGNLPG